jgi:hypothetical protein
MSEYGRLREDIRGTLSVLRQRYPGVVLGNLAEARTALTEEHKRRVEALDLERQSTARLLARWEAGEAAIAKLPE